MSPKKAFISIFSRFLQHCRKCLVTVRFRQFRQCIINCGKQLCRDWAVCENVQVRGCWRTEMKCCSWIYQWERARWFTPGQAPLLWRTACSAGPVRWVWCQTWAKCCSTCPAIPPGPQKKREDNKITLHILYRAFFHEATQRTLEDMTHHERKREKSCAITTSIFRCWDVMQIKVVSCWPGIDSQLMLLAEIWTDVNVSSSLVLSWKTHSCTQLLKQERLKYKA